jgi:hypothetical protein
LECVVEERSSKVLKHLRLADKLRIRLMVVVVWVERGEEESGKEKEEDGGGGGG